MTTTEVRRPPRHQSAPDPGPPVVRGPLAVAAVVLLLWGVWLLVPHSARLDLMGSPAGGVAGAADQTAGEPAVPDGSDRSDGSGGSEGSDGLAGDPVRPGAPDGPADAPDPAAGPGGAAAEAADGAAGAAGAPADPAGDAAPVAVPQAGDGTFAVAPGTGDQVGDGALVRYSVEVEGGVPVDPGEVASVVESVLADPRSWTGQGRWALQRVDADPDARIVITSPDTTDRLCAPLRTNGQVSCRNGDDVVLNALRWTQGAETWGADVVGYRQYLVNHELGHYLGNGHVGCPEPGGPAPVMLQQTLGLQGCAANAWPYP